MRKWTSLGALGVAGLLAGCSVGPDYQLPFVSVPGGFLAQAGEKSPQSANSTTADLTQWWRSLHDRELDSLVVRALQSNLDLAIALDRLQAARTQVIIAADQALPDVEAGGGGGGGTGSDNTNGRVSPTLRSGENAKDLKSINGAGGVDAAWELDLFGKIRREVEAQTADAEALKDARDWIFVTVAADVARAYLDMRAQQRQLVVLGQNIAAARGNLDLAQTRFSRGLTNEMDVSLAQRELATLQADQAPLTAQIDVSRHAIAVLLGQFPESLARELARSGPIPALPARIPVGLPVDLLRRRPDIREAERHLAAANARIGVAVAALFPTLVLTGAAGAQGGTRSSSLVPITWIGSLGPSVTMPLLDFGALDAQIEIADLQTHGLLATYRQAILTAVRQVDDADTSYRAQQERLASLDRALAAARQATQLATERYDRGLTDFLNVIDAEREQFDIEERHVAARQTAADDLVALYKALGGGWPTNEIIPPTRPLQPAIVAAAKHLMAPAQDH
ncbi:efflux transporter outer membrane subunit [Methylocapsa sp. S129]|uniref:efflux transporter outer membrane subunit n=1 Tax=Methylocapsa sp. S129 TaxID=1641869 RepID=UPI00131AD847|nr:efflux transporter outer membrane subunit [Methylocapsa sp. S129]